MSIENVFGKIEAQSLCHKKFTVKDVHTFHQFAIGKPSWHCCV